MIDNLNWVTYGESVLYITITVDSGVALYTGAYWGTGPTVCLYGPTIKIFAYHMTKLI